VLILDELPEFGRDVFEAFRRPMEGDRVAIAGGVGLPSSRRVPIDQFGGSADDRLPAFDGDPHVAQVDFDRDASTRVLGGGERRAPKPRNRSSTVPPPCELVAIARSTGQFRWRFETGDDPLGTAVASNGLAYVGATHDAPFGRLRAVDPATGRFLWHEHERENLRGPRKARVRKPAGLPIAVHR